jgi:hypothetical protein
MYDPNQPQGAYALDPQLVETMLSGPRRAQQRDAYGRRLDAAGRIRADGMSQLESRRFGKDGARVSPPTILNLGAAIMAGRKANQMQNEAETGLRNLGVEQSDALNRFFAAARSYRGQTQPLPYMGAEGE